MLTYIIRRILYMIPTLFAISVVAFFIIQLPPGDFLTSLVAGMSEQGETIDSAQLAALKQRYGLDQPFYVQYWKWISGIVLGTGDKERLESIRGMVPHPFNRPSGCPYHTRCDEAMRGTCNALEPPVEHFGAGREVRCLLYSDVAKVRAEQENRVAA